MLRDMDNLPTIPFRMSYQGVESKLSLQYPVKFNHLQRKQRSEMERLVWQKLEDTV